MRKIHSEILIQVWGGCVSLVDETNDGVECVIYRLFVDEDYRHQGVGSNLIKLALDYIGKRGYKKAFVHIDNKELIPFYLNLGFVRVGENEMYYFYK